MINVYLTTTIKSKTGDIVSKIDFHDNPNFRRGKTRSNGSQEFPRCAIIEMQLREAMPQLGA